RFTTDRGKLQQIFLNLFSNAFAAMDDGGHLDIRVTRNDADHAVVSISDTGCGIPSEDLDRIFEPFFSTKTTQGGTGLGLAITYGLIRGLGGSITAESVVGEGTTFKLTLPLEYPGKTSQGVNNESLAG
ncbi:MAG: HAMP domain-containing histidine kinase, partial [Planctomycetes bacterium]|nr:HAMP domain-containing histidine kinase [Planctomycetota bacterium]